MREWMCGFVAGTLVAICLPWLLPGWLCCLLAPLLALPWLRRNAALFVLSGACLALILTSLRGADLLARRLHADCNAMPAVITGRVASLPRYSRMQGGRMRQRFEFRVEDIA